MENANSKNVTNHVKEEIHVNEHMTEHTMYKPKHPLPPHERKRMLAIQFDEKDWEVFNSVFGNKDTASAAVDIVYRAPSEIQILVAQILKMIEKEVA